MEVGKLVGESLVTPRTDSTQTQTDSNYIMGLGYSLRSKDLIEELYDMFTTLEEKCNCCEKFIVQLYEHFKLKHDSDIPDDQSHCDQESSQESSQESPTSATSMIMKDILDSDPHSPVHFNHVSLMNTNIKLEPEESDCTEDPLRNHSSVIYEDDLFEYNTLNKSENEGNNSRVPDISLADEILSTSRFQQKPSTHWKKPSNFGVRLRPGEKYCTCVCWCCKMEFSIRNEFERHFVSAHEGELPYKCEICDKGFRRFTLLSRHINIHTGAKPFKCDICGKGYADGSNLWTHKRSHTIKKTFTCEICGKCLTTSYNFKMHLQGHEFRRLYDLSVHGVP